jgi:large subunit ribosomal protein L23
MWDVIKKPLVTEKSSSQSALGYYTFEVSREASKTDIKAAVEKAFRVKVASIKTQNCRSKHKRNKFAVVKPIYWKKAMVKLAKGEKIPLFEGA